MQRIKSNGKIQVVGSKQREITHQTVSKPDEPTLQLRIYRNISQYVTTSYFCCLPSHRSHRSQHNGEIHFTLILLSHQLYVTIEFTVLLIAVHTVCSWININNNHDCDNEMQEKGKQRQVVTEAMMIIKAKSRLYPVHSLNNLHWRYIQTFHSLITIQRRR